MWLGQWTNGYISATSPKKQSMYAPWVWLLAIFQGATLNPRIKPIINKPDSMSFQNYVIPNVLFKSVDHIQVLF